MCDILVIDYGSRFIENIINYLQKSDISFKRVENLTAQWVESYNPKGIILSGSPHSVYDEDAPLLDKKVLQLGIPVLGICYGAQNIAFIHGKKVAKAEVAELEDIEVQLKDSVLFEGLGDKAVLSMRHHDRVYDIPEGFVNTAFTKDCPYAAFENTEKKIFALQFHPEINITGEIILKNFINKVCKIDL